MLVSQIESIDSNRIHLEILEELEVASNKTQIRERLAQQYGFRFQNLKSSARARQPSASDQMKAMTFHTSYSMGDFMRYYDRDFIVCCFRFLLKRDPDPAALQHYVDLLRNGRYDRVLILARVYFSGESRQKKIKVRWLIPHFVLHALYAVPVLGYLFQLVVILLSLPAQARKQDHKLNAQVAELRSTIEHEYHSIPEQITNLIGKNNNTLMDGLGKILVDLQEAKGDQSPQGDKTN